MRYIPMTEQDRQAMLASMGISSVDELFSDILSTSACLRSSTYRQLKSEAELMRHMREPAVQTST